MESRSPVLNFARRFPPEGALHKDLLHRRARPDANRLLAALAMTPSYARLQPHLAPASLPLGEVLHEHGRTSATVYFPTTCVVSLSCVTASGDASELTAVGREGMIGIAAIMGAEAPGSWATVVSPGRAWSLPAKVLQQEFASAENCRSLLLRYVHALLMDISHHALCDARHCVQQRLCRLLLEMVDRGDTVELTATQEALAHRLGVRRESVSEVARLLQNNGVIRYHRGRIHSLDNLGLASLSCECHERIQAFYERVFIGESRLAAS